jgi:hypothetical protein
VSGLQQVHVRVNDAATGKPTPCRVRFTDAAGKYYAPHGRLTEFATDMGVDVGGNVLVGGQAFASIDGSCEILLPPGLIHVAVSKGPEYAPLQTEVQLVAGKLALRLELRRWIDMRAEGWWSGDTRAHFLTPHAALLEAAAEDVAVVNLLAQECLAWGDQGRQYPAISNVLAFSGQQPAVECPGHLVVVNTMNYHHHLGCLLLLNCHRVVYPLTTAGPNDFDNWLLADWCDQCHRKAGLVVGNGFFDHDDGLPPGELLADLILGKIDALQANGGLDNPAADAALGQESLLTPWYWLLDHGLRVPLVGGSCKDDNLTHLGSMRTYARLQEGQPFTYKNWIEAVRAGRTFVTTGPMLTLTVDGQDPGAVLAVAGKDAVRVRAEARSWTAFERLEVVGNHQVIASATAQGSPCSAVLEADIAPLQGGWLVARCWGAWDNAQEGWTAAQTSPVYFATAGPVRPPQAENSRKLFGQLDAMLDWVHHQARCASDGQRERLAHLFQEARRVLQSRLAP